MAKRDYLSREEYNAWMRRRVARVYAERRSWAVDLLGGECVHCGTQDGLEFDHIEPTSKSFNVGQHLGRYSKEKLLKELSKCQLLCRSCHREKTGVAKHGTRASYVGGCRCEDCTTANRTYYQEYWRKRRTAEA